MYDWPYQPSPPSVFPDPPTFRAYHCPLLSGLRRFLLLLFPHLLGAGLLFAQQNNVPLARDIHTEVERSSARLDSRMHTGLKPVLESRADLSDVMGYRKDTSKYYLWQAERLYRDHLLQVRTEDYFLAADFLFHFELAHDFGDRTLYADTNRYFHNMRGFRIRGDLGPKFSFETMFMENQAVVPQYVFRQSELTGVMSGQGRIKIEDRRKLDYGWSQSHISYSPAYWLNLQFGQGRHFVGHGYRSMLLSDHAISAPFLKYSFITRNRSLQYSSWHTKLQHGVLAIHRLPTSAPGERLFYWMRARFNHLSYSRGRFDVGLFEATIFNNIDEKGVRPFDALELNPVIGVNTITNGFDGPYESLVGGDLRIRITNKAYVYGQVATTDPERRRLAWQGGFRVFDVIRRDIHLQVEYNASERGMYRNVEQPRLSYMHSGLPLAHPFGSDFNEIVAIADIGLGRWRLQNRVVHGNYHLSADTVKQADPGQSILLDPEVMVARRVTYWDVNVSHLFNPKSNFRFVIGYTRRDLPGTSDRFQSSYVYLSLRTVLFNRYYDL